MTINKKDISLEEALKFSNYEDSLLVRRENNLLLSNYQVSVLNRNGINYKNFGSARELLFEIEACLDDYFDEELDLVGLQLYEYIYYNDTNK